MTVVPESSDQQLRPRALVGRPHAAPPAADPPPPCGDPADLRRFLNAHPRVFVLTGAGCSTESGIPDYRDVNGAWKRSKPVEYVPFMGEASVRSRYWARSMIGWRSFGGAVPNAAHRALAAMEASGRIELLLTQNVDGLHQSAGSQRVIDLHGRLDQVTCMSCGRMTPRADWQRLLEDLNASWAGLDAPVAPDGDADLDGEDFDDFAVPDCHGCGGIVKPDVVFFGESVPAWRHTQGMAALAACDAMLVVGSSLMVHSGYRYATTASRLGKPLAAVNLGCTRADHLLSLKVEAPVGATLSAVAA